MAGRWYATKETEWSDVINLCIYAPNWLVPVARPTGIGQPAPEPARSPATPAGPGKTAATGLHFRQTPHAGYIRRRPRHFRPVGTLRTSSTVLATLSLPLAAISMLGLPATIAAAGPTTAGPYLSSPKPVGTTRDKLGARTGATRPLSQVSAASTTLPHLRAFILAVLITFLAVLTAPSALMTTFSGGTAYPFDGTYHPELPVKKTSPTMVKLAAPGSIAAFGDATFLGAPGEHTRDIVGITLRQGYGQGYWAVGSGGGVFSYGDARFLGSWQLTTAPGK